MSHPLSHTDVRHAGVKAEGGRRMSVKQRHNQRIFQLGLSPLRRSWSPFLFLKRFASITLGPDIHLVWVSYQFFWPVCIPVQR